MTAPGGATGADAAAGTAHPSRPAAASTTGADAAAGTAHPSRPAAASTTGPDAPAGSAHPSGDARGTVVDPYRAADPAPAGRFLHRLNPLAKLLAPLPVMVVLLFSRGLLLPGAFVVVALVLLLVGARLPARTIAVLLVGLPLGVAVLGVSFGVWVDPGRLADDALGQDVVLWRVGAWEFPLAAYLTGVATALRLAALLMLSLIAGLTTTGPDLVRAMVQNLRVPYRVGYTALAAYRFVPRFGHELEVIRAAHRVRGTDTGRGPIAAVKRVLGYAVPLLASAIRHAERVALAMDARAFGAHATRTERHPVPWRARDWVFVAAFEVAAALLVWWALGAAPAPPATAS